MACVAFAVDRVPVHPITITVFKILESDNRLGNLRADHLAVIDLIREE